MSKEWDVWAFLLNNLEERVRQLDARTEILERDMKRAMPVKPLRLCPQCGKEKILVKPIGEMRFYACLDCDVVR